MTYIEIITSWIESIIESETGETWEQMDKNGLTVIESMGTKRIRLDYNGMILSMGFRRHAAENIPVTVSEEGLLVAYPPRPLFIYIPEAAHILVNHQGKTFYMDMRYNVFIREEYYQVFIRDGENPIISPMEYMHRGFEVSLESFKEAKQRMVDRRPVN